MPTHRQRELRKAIRMTAPLIPYADCEPVLAHAAKLAREDISPGAALWLALTTHVRHRHTDYDALLEEGYDRDAARYFVVEAMESVLRGWGCSRAVSTEDDT